MELASVYVRATEAEQLCCMEQQSRESMEEDLESAQSCLGGLKQTIQELHTEYQAAKATLGETEQQLGMRQVTSNFKDGFSKHSVTWMKDEGCLAQPRVGLIGHIACVEFIWLPRSASIPTDGAAGSLDAMHAISAQPDSLCLLIECGFCF